MSRWRHHIGMERIASLFRYTITDARPDGDLLGAFLGENDDPAFAELVRRHGSMVWGVCRRALPDTSDAEDAFQATFLVLVRRARGLVASPTIGSWLFKVASQTANNVRRKNARRIALFAELPDAVPDPRRVSEQSGLDILLLGLPERYRSAVLLCFLEGLTHREAADRLGCAEGTISSLVSRGLRKLRAKFAGRDPTALLVATGLMVPSTLASATIRSAGLLRLASLSTAASPAVAALTRGVLRMFWINKLTATSMVLFVAGLCFGISVWRSSVARGLENPSINVDSPPVVAIEKAATDPKKGEKSPTALIDPALEANVENDNKDQIVYGPINENGGWPCHLRSSKLGEKVEVEGLALGDDHQRVVYEGSMIVVKDVSFKELKANGKLVRVKGTLRYDGGSIARFRGEDGRYRTFHSQPFFYIESSSLEIIDKVTVAKLVLSDR
jgi:RNA polymerase sigma factor (sigma-70 family)